MKERPIIFSGPMVRAILEGRKTQTRRVVKVRGLEFIGASGDENDPAAWGVEWPDREGYASLADGIPCPYGPVGTRLWVRETHYVERAGHDGETGFILYKASEPDMIVSRWRPSIHMPRRASRILLEVTDVRVERVQDITFNDAVAEGVDPGCLNCGNEAYGAFGACGCADPCPLPEDAFLRLWDSINAKRGHGWGTNPWVWVVQFRVINAQEA